LAPLCQTPACAALTVWHEPRLGYLCKDKLNNQSNAAIEFLSGDNRTPRARTEMFDILWAAGRAGANCISIPYVNETSRRSPIEQRRALRPLELLAIKNMTSAPRIIALVCPGTTSDPRRQHRSVHGHFCRPGRPFPRSLSANLPEHKFNDHIRGIWWGGMCLDGRLLHQTGPDDFLRAKSC